MRRSCILSFIILVSSCDGILEKMDDSFRLPSTIRPLRYDLTVEPNLANSYFNGSVSIRLIANNITDRITLHAKNLFINLHSIRIIDKNGTTRRISNVGIDQARDFYTVELLQPLLADEQVDLKIEEFSGWLTFDNVGFYLAKYKDEDDNEKVFALTDFQPIGARKAFPCFDEPSLKATFLVSIVRRDTHISASNEELISTVDLGGGRFQDNYKETLNMSTYLVAFSVSDYKRTSKNGSVRVYAPSHDIRKGKVDFVRSVAEEALWVLENYTAVKYPMSKLDMFAVPSEYFEPGGMENWGLITFSDNNLFCTNESTIQEIQKCTMMTVHEIAHQWFGNLVTPQWWNFLWLSEGFSTYMEYYATSLINPSWNMMDQFVVFLLQPLLKVDMMQYLNYDAPYAGVLPAAYAAYYKGAAIVRMLQHILTDETFQLGVEMYLNNHAYSSVTPTDLYDAFQAALSVHNKSAVLDNLTIAQIMSTWDTLPGYPLVTVFRNPNGSIFLSQKPFWNTNIDNTWYIPINFVTVTSTLTTPQLWLKEKSMVIQPNTSTDWILINSQQTGYYRTNYDLQNWRSISNLLNGHKFYTIHVSNRAQLIDDAFILASHNHLPYSIPLNLSLYLRREIEYLPLMAFFNNVEKIKLYLVHLRKENVFRSYMKNLLENLNRALGFEEKVSDRYLDRYNRINLVAWSCNLNLFGCRENALQAWRLWLVNGTRISTDLEVEILCGAMQSGTEEDWEFLYANYKMTVDKSKKTKLLTGLGCTGDMELFEKFLGMVLKNGSDISVGDRKTSLTRAVQIGQDRVDAVFKFLVRHVQENDIYQELRVVDVLCRHVIKEQQLDVLSLLKLALPQSPLIRLCFHHANKNMAWLQEDNLRTIGDWFEVYSGDFKN